jgi:hypothetical protein
MIDRCVGALNNASQYRQVCQEFQFYVLPGSAAVWADVGHLLDLPYQKFQHIEISGIRCPTSL